MKLPLIYFGLFFLAAGLIYFFSQSSQQSAEVEVIPAEEVESAGKEIVVDVAGAVENPGVYRLASGSRINDALVAAGGLSVEADRDWVAKNINLAAELKDGIKIYINTTKSITSQMQTAVAVDAGTKININTASLSDLDKLPGIGPVIGQRIIDYRQQKGSFVSPEDLLQVDGVSQKVFDKIKGLISVF